MILVRSSRNTWTAGSSVCCGWMMPRSQSSSALSSLPSFSAMREMVSGGSICCPGGLICCLGGSICCLGGSICSLGGSICCLGGSICCPGGSICCLGGSICCPRRAVHGALLPRAAAAATSCRFPRSSPAFFSAFSILLISQHSQQTHYGERRRKGKRGRNNQRQYRQFLTQTCQLPCTPQVRHDRCHPHFVSLGYCVRETHARIEFQPGEKKPEGNQNPEHDTPEHELPESR